MKKIYLAGPQVFLSDAKAVGEKLKVMCKEFGFLGLYPLDNECDSPQDIYRGNTELIKSCDYVIADVNAFRGFEPDSGTAFEIGYAIALGKTVVVYTNETRPMIEWVKDNNGYSVEDFGYPLNLMIACSSKIVHGGAYEALEYITNLTRKS